MVVKMMRSVLLILTMSIISPAAQADEQVVCDCYVKNNKTSCSVDLEADASMPCACVKETMYGKRKFKEKACVVGDSNSK
ncbi:hypothetical protein N8Z26_07340 [Burkholderiales bacterium]|nr:hypothetical protein [Burkholderiales bacterium]